MKRIRRFLRASTVVIAAAEAATFALIVPEAMERVEPLAIIAAYLAAIAMAGVTIHLLIRRHVEKLKRDVLENNTSNFSKLDHWITDEFAERWGDRKSPNVEEAVKQLAESYFTPD